MIGGQCNSSEQDMTKMSETILWLGREHARTAHKLRRNFPLGRNIQPKLEKDTSVSVSISCDQKRDFRRYSARIEGMKTNSQTKTNKKKSCRVFFSRILYIKKTRQTNISLDAVLRYLIMFCRQKRAVKLSIMTGFSKINLKVGRHAKDKQTRT